MSREELGYNGSVNDVKGYPKSVLGSDKDYFQEKLAKMWPGLCQYKLNEESVKLVAHQIYGSFKPSRDQFDKFCKYWIENKKAVATVADFKNWFEFNFPTFKKSNQPKECAHKFCDGKGFLTVVDNQGKESCLNCRCHPGFRNSELLPIEPGVESVKAYWKTKGIELSIPSYASSGWKND